MDSFYRVDPAELIDGTVIAGSGGRRIDVGLTPEGGGVVVEEVEVVGVVALFWTIFSLTSS